MPKAKNPKKQPDKNVTFFWFRRDLRLHDNAGLYHALKDSEASVLPLFIFDTEILEKLPNPADARVEFIHSTLQELKKSLQKLGSDLLVMHGKPSEVFEELLKKYKPTAVFTNHDYEPSARRRDDKIEKICTAQKVEFKTFKDQSLFEKEEILTDARKPYTVYTPYKRKVYANLSAFYLKSYPTEKYFSNFAQITKPFSFPSLKSLGFAPSPIKVPPIDISPALLKAYKENRNFPATPGTAHLGAHLRFGTISIRELAREGKKYSETWLSELVWRDFFMQILWHFPQIEKHSYRPIYDTIAWRNSKKDFKRWSEGQTGYVLVDAGMRELNATGFMHNRVRMVVASFLCKHLLIHWREGERYFAEKLLDYDMAANNGNWQWAAGSGCDAAPYFRIFNPMTQAEKFDPDNEYIRQWVPEFETEDYVKPMVNHTEARDRCLRAFYAVLKGKKS